MSWVYVISNWFFSWIDYIDYVFILPSHAETAIYHFPILILCFLNNISLILGIQKLGLKEIFQPPLELSMVMRLRSGHLNIIRMSLTYVKWPVRGGICLVFSFLPFSSIKCRYNAENWMVILELSLHVEASISDDTVHSTKKSEHLRTDFQHDK